MTTILSTAIVNNHQTSTEHRRATSRPEARVPAMGRILTASSSQTNSTHSRRVSHQMEAIVTAVPSKAMASSSRLSSAHNRPASILPEATAMAAMLLTAISTPRPCYRSWPSYRAPPDNTPRAIRQAAIASSRRTSHPLEATAAICRTASVTTPPCQRSKSAHRAPRERNVALALDDTPMTRLCQLTTVSTVMTTAPTIAP